MSDWNTGVALEPVFLQHALLHKFRRAIPKATRNAARRTALAAAGLHGSSGGIRHRRRGPTTAPATGAATPVYVFGIPVSYVVGFFVMLAILGWHPDATHKKRVDLAPTQTSQTIVRGT
jgi:hypothetical protein